MRNSSRKMAKRCHTIITSAQSKETLVLSIMRIYMLSMGVANIMPHRPMYTKFSCLD